MSLGIAVFASGGGTNLQALLDHFNGACKAPGRIVLVVSDRAGAGALERARRAGVSTRVIEVRGRAEEDVAEEMLEALAAAGIGLVVLAGYLRLIPPRVVAAYHGRMLNIHPALLPAFGGAGMYGMHIHRAVLAAGCRVSGVTVHLVDERYDTGPILIQWPVPVLAGDTPESLAARVLAVEHRVLPVTVGVVAERLGGAAVGALDVASELEARELAFGLSPAGAPHESDIRHLLAGVLDTALAEGSR